MVERVSIGNIVVDGRKARIWADGVGADLPARYRNIGHWLVDIYRADIVDAARSDVPYIQQEISRQLPLHVERPLLQITNFPGRIEVAERYRKVHQLAVGRVTEV